MIFIPLQDIIIVYEFCFGLGANKCGVTYLDRRSSVLVDLDAFKVVSIVRSSISAVTAIYDSLLQLLLHLLRSESKMR